MTLKINSKKKNGVNVISETSRIAQKIISFINCQKTINLKEKTLINLIITKSKITIIKLKNSSNIINQSEINIVIEYQN